MDIDDVLHDLQNSIEEKMGVEKVDELHANSDWVSNVFKKSAMTLSTYAAIVLFAKPENVLGILTSTFMTGIVSYREKLQELGDDDFLVKLREVEKRMEDVLKGE